MKKKLIVCGDSFMAATQDIPSRHDCLGGGHFTELFAKQLNLEYDTLARGGASNFLIYLQVVEAIKLKPDFIIVGFTDGNRIEILNAQHHSSEPDRAVTLYDFNYHEYPDLSTQLRKDLWKDKPYYISTSIINVIDHPDGFEDKGRLFDEKYYNIYKDYFTNFHSYKVQLEYQTLIVEKTISLLEKSGIKYTLTGLMMPTDNKNDMRANKDLNPWHQPMGGPYRFHTTAETQVALANKWINYYKNLWQINN